MQIEQSSHGAIITWIVRGDSEWEDFHMKREDDTNEQMTCKFLLNIKCNSAKCLFSE